ncbi:MAG: hypothetical protein B6U89_06995 [Desulfurococcales archaeon ex4484_58]|nr:MAG: hypothetical protein B6U89_06995 [Desulfurococcales archaeon ex4484_58]
MLYVYTLIAMGIIWVLITLWFQSKIKKMWLYTLFPTVIYSIALMKYINTQYIYVVALVVLITTIYFIIEYLRGFKYRDTLIIPLILIITVIILEAIKG